MISRLYRIYALLLSTFVLVGSLYAQTFPSLSFSHITTKEGLSTNYTTAVAEDKQGFIWIGTSNGLNRYDGYHFKHYYHSNTDSNSLIHNDIQTLYCDSKNRIWVTTVDGISCFNPVTNQFINYATKFKAPYHLKNNNSAKIYEDEYRQVWICNQLDVIYRINEKMGAEPVSIKVTSFAFYEQILSGYINIFRDKQNREWAFMANVVYLLDKKTKQPVKTYNFSATLKAPVLKMIQDDDGNYFLCTWNSGVYQFEPGENLLKPVTALPRKIFTDIANWKYKNKHWLMCVEINTGIYLMDMKTGASMLYGNIEGDPSSLNGNILTQFFLDSKNNIWIVSNTGVNFFSSGPDLFNVIPVTDPGSKNYDVKKNGIIFSYFEADSNVWLSKRFVSTFNYDQDFQIKNFYKSLYPASSAAFRVNGYAYDFYKKGDELFITTDSGFIIYNTIKNSSVSYLPSGFNQNLSLRTIIELNEKELLIRCFDYGLFIFNTIEKKFTGFFNIKTVCDNCIAVRASYLFKTTKNEIYVCAQGTTKSFFKFNPKTGIYSQVKPINENNFSMQSSALYGINEDSDGKLWIASSAGLFIYDPLKNLVEKQLAENKEIGTLFRICFDKTGNAWMNGPAGIWCYVKSTGKWIGFNSQDGLPGSQFDAVIARRPNGDIVAGLEGAIVVFHPDMLFKKENESPAIITEAIIGDSSIPFPLLKSSTKTFQVKPGQNSFSVDFAVLGYKNPVANRYFYKLEPLMKEFQQNENGHINFNGLSPGTYTLHVKGGNKAGIIYSNEDMLKIEVLPHWYQSPPFKIFSILLAAVIAMIFLKTRIRVVKKQAVLKQQIAETEMQALRAQMNPHFIFNSLNGIENFMMQNEKRLASDYLNKFSRLIRSILDSSRNELVPIAKDMEALQLYVDLQQLRFNNKFSYQTAIDPVLLDGDFKVPSLLIQPFVENAIEHGIAHSDKENLVLIVKASLKDEFIVYIVEDNGIGRNKAAEYNRHNKPHHKSVGLTITTDRLRILNKKNNGENSIEIADLYNEKEEPSGTKVTLKIKPQ